MTAFVKAADLGSFVAAGRVMELSASAVGKAVLRLEQEMGSRLLQRSTRHLSLTEEGKLFHERCKKILDELDDAESMLQHSRRAPKGRLRISTPLVSYHLLLPLIPDFVASYPDIDLDIDFNDRIVDLIDENVDVAIRSGVLPDSRLISRPLRHFRLMLCASPAYLQAHGKPANADDLIHHTGICFRYPNSGKLLEWPLSPENQDSAFRLKRTLIFNNMEAVRGATLRGLGIGCMPDFLVQEPVNNGDLYAVLDTNIAPTGRFHAIWPSNRHLSPKVRVFVDFICERLG